MTERFVFCRLPTVDGFWSRSVLQELRFVNLVSFRYAVSIALFSLFVGFVNYPAFDMWFFSLYIRKRNMPDRLPVQIVKNNGHRNTRIVFAQYLVPKHLYGGEKFQCRKFFSSGIVSVFCMLLGFRFCLFTVNRLPNAIRRKGGCSLS
jgi:hypothetical protein